MGGAAPDKVSAKQGERKEDRLLKPNSLIPRHQTPQRPPRLQDGTARGPRAPRDQSPHPPRRHGAQREEEGGAWEVSRGHQGCKLSWGVRRRRGRGSRRRRRRRRRRGRRRRRRRRRRRSLRSTYEQRDTSKRVRVRAGPSFRRLVSNLVPSSAKKLPSFKGQTMRVSSQKIPTRKSVLTMKHDDADTSYRAPPWCPQVTLG